jgi:hypothetical protein
MKFISHRGNFKGIDKERENTLEYALEAIAAGYDVELDVRFHNGGLWFGHDEPKEEIIDEKFLISPRIWVHAKDTPVYWYLKHKLIGANFFMHEDENYCITSMGYVWQHSRLGPFVFKAGQIIGIYADNFINPHLSLLGR